MWLYPITSVVIPQENRGRGWYLSGPKNSSCEQLELHVLATASWGVGDLENPLRCDYVIVFYGPNSNDG